jgi:parvulin-like peptidyl-prolyl isomerase
MKKYRGIIVVVCIVALVIGGLATGTYFLLKPRFIASKTTNLLFEEPSGLSEKQANVVVAEVNEEKVLYEDFFSQLYPYFKQTSYSFNITEDNVNSEENKEIIKNLKIEILDSIIKQRLALQKAAEQGFTLTDEYIENATEQMITAVSQEMENRDISGESGRDYKQEAVETIEAEAAAYGIETEEYYREYAQYLLITDFLEHITKDVEVTEEDIQKYYDEQLNAQQSNPSQLDYADVQLVKIAGTMVKHILIALPQEEQQEYRNLMNQGKEEEAETYLQEKLEVLKPKAQEVLDKVNNGEDFEELLEQYGEDLGMKSEEYKDGYFVTGNGEYISSFEEASLALKEGEVSGLVAGSFGYHIIKAYEIVEGGPYTFEEKREEIKVFLDNQEKAFFVDKKMKEWEEASKITKYENRL